MEQATVFSMPDEHGMLPLHYAVQHNADAEAVQLLLDQADANGDKKLDTDELSELVELMESKNMADTVKELIKLVELTSFEFFIITDNDLSVVGFYCDCKARICSPDVSHKYHLHILEEN